MKNLHCISNVIIIIKDGRKEPRLRKWLERNTININSYETLEFFSSTLMYFLVFNQENLPLCHKHKNNKMYFRMYFNFIKTILFFTYKCKKKSFNILFEKIIWNHELPKEKNFNSL